MLSNNKIFHTFETWLLIILLTSNAWKLVIWNVTHICCTCSTAIVNQMARRRACERCQHVDHPYADHRIRFSSTFCRVARRRLWLLAWVTHASPQRIVSVSYLRRPSRGAMYCVQHVCLSADISQQEAHYRRGTARRAVSVKTLSTAARLYEKSHL